ncbi:MAG: hypothetical protein JWQ81_2343 [Amycolatopsis sp.]|jgi:hypothetical protein|uniref:hypothetical protein n=1 Tax=Amycolatopsis sp. TaxID=37632 RepID=UPI002609A109|nr:hypothetical protein [Amycolatopsis sp.]MCU1681604.1 hypothetical protein [Amycolatopsis sp.]
MFLKIVGALLVIWLAFSVLGFVFHALLWIGIIGAVLFLGTAAVGAIKGKSDPKRIRN